MADAEVLPHVVEATVRLIESVGPDELTLATPCPGRDVATTIAHVAARLHALRDDLHAGDAAEHGGRWDPGVASAVDVMRVAARGLTADAPAAPTAVVELVAHGWDIAVATGRQAPFSSVEAAAALRLGHDVLAAAARGPGCPFGPIVMVARSAPPLDHFIGLTGRRPAGGL